jgi:hypothetical protein
MLSNSMTMVWVAHEGHRLRPERHDGEGAVGRRIRHDPDVRLALHHRFHHLVRMQAFQLDARLRVKRHEALHVPAHVVQADRVDRSDAHGAVHPRLHRRDLGPRLLPRLEQPPTGLVEGLALGGHDERALGAIEEGDAQLRLELLHRLARR